MRIVFMGTPDFSVPTLESLVKGGHEVLAVVTQPDKPKGRGKSVLMTPVKEKALELGIPVYQPVKVREPEFMEVLKGLDAEVFVVVAFGQILPMEILEMPRYGCVNVHASLLPRYRGAAPIQWAVIDGEAVSGVTTMLMDEGLDTGDMLEKAEIPLDKEETGGSLFEKLSLLGGELILSTLEKLQNGTAVRTPQGEPDTPYAKMLKKSMGQIDWSMEAEKIERLIRGLNPWPSAYTSLNGKTVKIWAAEVVPGNGTGVPGRAAVSRDSLLVETGKDLLSIKELQLEGKKRMDTAAFLRGFQVEDGTVLGYGELGVVLDEGCLEKIAVADAWRRQGVAEAILSAFIRFGRANLAFLTLEVRESNRAAIGLYEKLGFRPVGRRKNYYTEVHEDAILMTLEWNEHRA